MPRVLVLTLGATALQRYDAASQRMELKHSPRALLDEALQALEGVEADLQALPFRSGAELTWATLAAVRDAVAAGLAAAAYAGYVLLCGTDTMEEAAFALHLMLGAALAAAGVPLCLTERCCRRINSAATAPRTCGTRCR